MDELVDISFGLFQTDSHNKHRIRSNTPLLPPSSKTYPYYPYQETWTKVVAWHFEVFGIVQIDAENPVLPSMQNPINFDLANNICFRYQSHLVTVRYPIWYQRGLLQQEFYFLFLTDILLGLDVD
ncbi:hypothetical protein D3C72_2030620 [compost metagenome]